MFSEQHQTLRSQNTRPPARPPARNALHLQVDATHDTNTQRNELTVGGSSSVTNTQRNELTVGGSSSVVERWASSETGCPTSLSSPVQVGTLQVSPLAKVSLKVAVSC